MAVRFAVELRRDDALADYLTTEVLAAVDPELRPFLIAATVDDLVCADARRRDPRDDLGREAARTLHRRRTLPHP